MECYDQFLEGDMDIGPTELIIILLIVVLLFGVGRIGKIAGELGSGIRAFREGLRGDDADKPVVTKAEGPPIPDPLNGKGDPASDDPADIEAKSSPVDEKKN
jgi:sec-independent protein translocase protein TatA